MPKRTLRRQMLAQRRALSQDQRQAYSLLAQQRLIGLDEYRQSACIALYAPLQNEVDDLFGNLNKQAEKSLI